jgi:hypothetical protein
MNLDFFENKYFFAVFSIFMFMYAAQIRPTLPKFMMDLFQNPIFRVAILFLILVRGYKDPQFSLIVAVAFLLIMNVVNEQLFKETFADTPGTSATPASSSDSSTNTAQQSTELNDKCSNFELDRKIVNYCIDNLPKKQECGNLSGDEKTNCIMNNANIEANLTKLDVINSSTSSDFNKNCNNVQFSSKDVPKDLNCKDKFKLA